MADLAPIRTRELYNVLAMTNQEMDQIERELVIERHQLSRELRFLKAEGARMEKQLKEAAGLLHDRPQSGIWQAALSQIAIPDSQQIKENLHRSTEISERLEEIKNIVRD